MKNLIALLLSTLLIWSTNPQIPSTSVSYLGSVVVAAPVDVVDENSVIAEYNKPVLGRILDWGLAKVESVFDGQVVMELFSAFLSKCDEMFMLMIHSFKEIFMSYGQLHEKEVQRLAEFDKDFNELVKLRQKIDRRCLLSSNEEDRSLCVEKGIDIKNKIQALRKQRTKSSNAIGRYESWMAWCASYKNWFC
jgi:hypothetical protein